MPDRPPRVDELASRGRSNGRLYTVYVLKSLSSLKSYVGFSDDVNRRLKEHNSGKNYYTKRYMPWKIIHTEEFKLLKEAVKREKYLKSASGRRIVLKKLFEE